MKHFVRAVLAAAFSLFALQGAFAASGFDTIYPTTSAVVCATDQVCAQIGHVRVQAVTVSGVTGTGLYSWQGTCPGAPDFVPAGSHTGCFALEGLAAPGTGVKGPASSTSGDLASFSGSTGTVIQDTGILSSTVVAGPASVVSGNIASYNGTSGKALADSGVASTNVVQGPASAVSGDIASFSGTGGKLVQDSGVAASAVVTLSGTQTLTNKALTAPVISSITNTGTLTLPTSSDTLVGRATTDTLTNKTIPGASNTITNPINATPGSVTAAATTDLSISSATVQTVSGNTGITSFGTAAGLFRIVKFTGTPLITYNATSLITPTGGNIQAAPGDIATLVSDGSGNWTIAKYLPYGGVKSASASSVACSTSGTAIGSVALLPGKWRISGLVVFASGNTNRYARGSIDTTSGSGTGTTGVSNVFFSIDTTEGVGSGAIPSFDVTLTSNTNYFLNGAMGNNADSLSGSIRAERIF